MAEDGIVPERRRFTVLSTCRWHCWKSQLPSGRQISCFFGSLGSQAILFGRLIAVSSPGSRIGDFLRHIRVHISVFLVLDRYQP
jgi:hypothetical protein